jgi:hypothetical protein
MLKYKNRLTPNVNTLHQLITFYKRKKTSPLSTLNRLSALWIMQSLNKNQPPFQLIFNNIFSLTHGSWNLTRFTLSLNNSQPQKYFSTLLKASLFQKKQSLVKPQKLTLPFNNYSNLMSMNLLLIGKPFNSQNAYFFSSKNYEEDVSTLRPFFSKIIWKRHVLKTLKHRFTLNVTNNLSNQTKFKSLLTKSFGGPVPTNNNLFLKPYLFTNNEEKKQAAKHFSLTLLKSPFNLFKSTTKNFVRRRYTWTNVNLKKYSRQFRTTALLSSFNLISSLQAKKVKNVQLEALTLSDKLTTPLFFKKFSFKVNTTTSKFLLSETVKLLYLNKALFKAVKSLTLSSNTLLNNFYPYSNSSSTFYLQAGKTSPRFFNRTKKHFTYKVVKLLAKRRSKLFRIKKTRRAKFLKKLIKSPSNLLSTRSLKNFLVRPRRWGRKFLRRLSLKKNLNLTTFSLRLLKTVSSTSTFFTVNYSLLRKKFLWRKFLKWRKVRKLKKISIRQELLFNDFFLKYLRTNFATPKVLSKLKFRLNLVKNLTPDSQIITLFPNLLNLSSLKPQFTTYSINVLAPQLFTDNISLVSNYSISFILPVYGFLFITSDKLTTNQQTNNQLSLKKTVHSFFYLSDLKSFVAGKHSSIVNNYNSFFTPTSLDSLTTGNYLDSPISSNMTSFLTTSFTSLLDQASNSNFLQRRENDPRIPRFKFKPGYSRIWRRARTGIKEYFQIKFQYQHRLTKFLPQFYKLSRISLIKSTELKLENLLLFTHLLPDLVTCQEFFNSNLVFLNGRTVFSGKVYTVRNDFIQILVSIKYYILFKWFMNWEVLKKTRLNRLLYLSRLKTKRTFRKTLPDWVLRKISYPYDVPKYVEVDYLTLSAFVLYEPYLSNDFTHMFQKFSRSPIYNVYNWKYLT